MSQIKRKSDFVGISFSRLSHEDIPRISDLLMLVWPRLYGDLGHPVFSQEYLHWMYGGPHKEKHVLIGAWLGKDLIGYQCFLYRTICSQGRPFNAYLNTHAAISPALPSELRMQCGFEIIKQHVLFEQETQFHTDCDLVCAFYDAEKNTASILDRQLKRKFGMQRKTISSFNQFLVLPQKLEPYLKSFTKKTFAVRAASIHDLPQLTALFNQETDGTLFSRRMTEDELAHHFFGRYDHRTYIVEEGGTVNACVNFYPLETIKEGKMTTHVLVEYLVASVRRQEHIAALLGETVKFAEEIGAKNVVLENANYLDYSESRVFGLAPTLRRMSFTALWKDQSLDYTGPFRFDIK